jgi:3-hydroxyacyl-CoA dehydrogenase
MRIHTAVVGRVGPEVLATIDHVGVACRERPGFLVNRLQYALLVEAYRILEREYRKQR